MYRKNLVGEIQRLAKELNKMPTEEANLKLADLSKSNLAFDPRGSNSINNANSVYLDGKVFNGMIGNHESSVLMDLNRASIIKA